MGELSQIRWTEWLPFWRWRIVCIVDAADEVPNKLPRNAAVLVGSYDSPKWLAFDCPCRTGHRIMITLDPTRRPHWRIEARRHLSVRPSVDFRTPERRCHYIIRNGNIVWAGPGN